MKILSITNMYPSDTDQKGVFVKEINDGLNKLNVDVDVFNIDSLIGGLRKYIFCIPKLFRLLKVKNYQAIHVHYGLSFFPVFFLMPLIKVFKLKVVVFFHGSDVMGEVRLVRYISYFSAILSDTVITVSPQIKEKLISKTKLVKFLINEEKLYVIPCGINDDFFELNNKPRGIDIIFPSSPIRTEKNFPFFKSVFDEIKHVYPDARYVIFENLDREEIKQALVHSKIMLLTSDREGSPQVYKEAMAVGLPVLSRIVGDVALVSEFSPNAYVSSDDNFVESALKILAQDHIIEFDKNRLFNELSQSSICRKILKVTNES